MPRFGYKSLLVLLFLVAGTVPLAAYYYLPDNQPPGPPPNYNPIEPEHFYGVPSLSELPPADLDGYFVYFDSTEGRWSMLRVIPFGTSTYEQFHGSMLVQLDGEPQPGVNVWPEGFELSNDLHRNDRWGWVQWPDSIAPNLYEIWWDITIECPEPTVQLTRTIGFWKNHSGMGPQDDLVTQYLPIWLGTPDGPKSVLVSDAQIAFDILSMALSLDQLDGISKLYAQLLATKLDIASGTDGTVVFETIDLADAFLAEHDPSDWPNLDGATQQLVLDWKNIFDSYNNGYIGPGHEDDGVIIVDCDEEEGCPPCVVGMSFSGCAFDFNLWGSSYNQTFGADLIYLGEQRIPLSSIPEYSDTFEGLDDPYGHPFDCDSLPDGSLQTSEDKASLYECFEPNLSVYGSVMYPGAAYNVLGLIESIDDYGVTYGGARVYEGNGIQFSVNDCGENNPPVFDPPIGYLKPVLMCLGGTIYDTIVANDFDPGAFVTITKISGLGDFISTPGNPPVYGYYSWTPTESGSFTVIFEATDNHGASVIDSIVYQLILNQPPVITAADSIFYSCLGNEQICYTIPVTNEEVEPLTFTLLSGGGDLDPVTGELCFMPSGAGEYPFEVAVYDSCGADTAAFAITVVTNTPPMIVPYDTIIALCETDSICFEVTAFDPDPKDSLEITLISGPGIFTQIGNGIGTHCFLPDPVDSARYVFHYSVTDDCWRDAVNFAASPPLPPNDSIVVIVVTDQPPVISCPDYIDEALCAPDTLCYQIEGYDPENGELTYSVISGPGTIDSVTGLYCFYVEEPGSYLVTLSVADLCGNSDECTFTINVQVNQPPSITIEDASFELCDLEEVCLPYVATDPDNNIVKITVETEDKSNIEIDGQVCFIPMSAGTYNLIVTATDSCGLSATDTATVTIILNQPPVVSVGDSMAFICEASEICLPITMSDPDGVIDSVVAMAPAYYNSENQTVCVPVDEYGLYVGIVVVYDDCGATAMDVGRINLRRNSPPELTVPEDTIVSQCILSEICLDGFEITDADDNIVSIEFLPDLGTYSDGRYCFTPVEDGEYCITVRVTDECGEITEKVFCVKVELGVDPVITCPAGPLVANLCGPDSVCMEIPIDPASAVITVLEEGAVYENGKLCIYAEASGVYNFTLIATGDCGADTCNATFDISLDVTPQVTCPPSEAIHLCEPGNISVPLSFEPELAILTIVPETEYTDGMLTFFADEAGDYEFSVYAETSCGIDSCTFVISVTLDSPPVVTIADSVVYQCDFDEVCLPYSFSDPDNNVASVTVIGLKDYLSPNETEGEICFVPDQPGINELVIVVTDSCGNTDSDTASVVVVLNQPPVATLENTSFYLCEPGNVCFPLIMSDPDGVIDSVVVMPPAYYDPDNQTVCLPVDQTGLYQVAAVVYDDCGASAFATVVGRVIINYTPTVAVPEDTTIFQCDLTEICLTGFEIHDINYNLSTIEFIPDIGTYTEGQYCFVPEGAGEYCIVVRATDSCGAFDEDTVCVKVEIGDDVNIACPEGVQEILLCGPDSVCLDIPIMPVTAEIIVVEDGAVYENGKLCFFAEVSGNYTYTMIATGDCGSDTCQVTFDVTVDEVPQITCPPSDTVHLCGPDSIKVPLGFTPETANLTINPPADYSNGVLTFYADEPGEYCFEVIAANNCGSDTCDFCITVTFDSPPVATATDSSIYLCEIQEICVPVSYSDPDNNLAHVYVTPDDMFRLDGDTVCFTPTEAGVYEYFIVAIDSCGNEGSARGEITITMNQGPSVEVGMDSIFICEPAVICLPMLAYDSDGVIDSIIVSDPWYHNADTSGVCREVTESGVYEVSVTVYDDCGASATDNFGVAWVFVNADPVVTLPADTAFFLCEPQEICFPVNFSDADENIQNISVLPDGHEIIDGNICFFVESSGAYEFIVTVTDSCGISVADTMTITLDLNQPPVVEVGDTTLFSCDPLDVCVPVMILDLDGVIDSVVVTEPAYYNDIDQTICLLVEESGSFDIAVTVYDDCGASASDTATFNVTINSAPQVIAPADTTVFACEPAEICLTGFEYIDIDGNISGVEFFPDPGTYGDSNYCFTPTESGEYCFVVKVTDECGLTDEDTVCVNYQLGVDVAITCPDGNQPVSLCDPDSVCLDITVEPASAVVTVLEPGAIYENGKLCFFAEGEGQYTYTLVAEGDCGNDTCQVTFDVSLMAGPQIVCPSDTAIHLCDPDSISIPIGVMGISSEVIVSPEGVYADGMVTFFAGSEGQYCFEVIANNECGSDTCNFCVTVTIDSPPVVTISDTSLFLCNLEEICLPYDFSDPDDNIVSVTVTPKRFYITEGEVCFVPTGSGIEEIILTVADACGHITSDTAVVEITMNQDPSVYVGDTSVFLCDPTELCVPVISSDIDGVIDSIVVAEPAYYNPDNQTVCLYVTESGNHAVIATVYDDCGAAVTDTGIITVRYNYYPIVEAPADTSVLLCEPTEICLDGFSVIDIDGNLEMIEFIPDIGTYTEGTYCFTPQEPGEYCIIMRAIDTCGASGQDTVCVTVTWGEFVSLTCPEGIQLINLCDPDTICVDVPVEPLDTKVTVLEAGGYYNNGQLCFYADTSGRYTFTVVADGDCNADTCMVTVDVSLGELPVITCPEPITEHLCGPDSISVPLPITPITAEIIITPDASYADGMLTFYASKDGEYCFEVIAAGECGNDTCNFCVTVTFDSPPIVGINDSSLYLCELQEICIPVDYSDPDNNIKTIEIFPPEYSLIDDAICFTPPDSGEYEIIVTVTDSCENQVVDTALVNVSLNVGPSVTVADSSVFLCGSADICLAVEMSDPDGVIDSVVVSEPAYYDAANHLVCLPVDADGSYDIIVTVYDDCGESATDTGTAVVATNTGPTVEFGSYPNPMNLCDLSEICIPIVVYDAEENIVEISGSTTCGGEITFGENDDFICWLPNTFGPCTITVIVTDICGESDTATASIELIELPRPNPPCPDDTTIMACEIDEKICIDLGDVQSGSHLTIRPSYYSYLPDHGELCYFADGDRTDTITVIDSTECGIDSCQFVLTTIMNRPPVIAGVAPSEIEFCDSVNLCIDYTVSDPDNNVVSIRLESDCPGAILDAANSRVCIEITTALDCSLNIIVVDSCGEADTLILPILATPNQPPVIHLPNIETVVRCEDDTTSIVIPDFCVTDADYDEVILVLDSGLGEFTFDPVSDCGELVFVPPTSDTAQYCFKFRASDDCNTVYETYCLNILPSLVCSTCVEVWIEDQGCVNSGQITAVDINIDVTNDIAAYDMLISYDASALSFLRAEIGFAIDKWEYFTYRFGDLGNCQSPCPSGLIRLVAIADINNGPFHPPEEQLHPEGNIASIIFRVSNDLNLGGQSIPINFFWMDCGDNGFSDPSGQYLYVDNIIYSLEGNIVWDEANDAAYPESNRLPHVGIPDECLVGDKYEPVRCVSLHNGELCITHPDSVDARGDMNLNGVAYEIADAVVYTNYFINGLGAFNISVPGQIAASDVNADGLTLSIADLVYLVRVIVGDAPPYPKPIVGDNTVAGSLTRSGTEATVSIESDQDIGATLLVFSYEGETTVEPVLAEAVENMDIKFGWMNGNLRVLIYSFEAGAMIKAGATDLIRIDVPEGGKIELVEMDLADYYGRVLDTEIDNAVLPQKLELSQNYPNPFNPTTTFDLALPTASDYVVTIYNVTGQVIQQWSGYAEAGYVRFEWNGCDEDGQAVASGIYLYRAQVANSDAIKKMLLLK